MTQRTVTVIHPITCQPIQPGDTEASQAVHAALVAHHTRLATAHEAANERNQSRKTTRRRARVEAERRRADIAADAADK